METIDIINIQDLYVQKLERDLGRMLTDKEIFFARNIAKHYADDIARELTELNDEQMETL